MFFHFRLDGIQGRQISALNSLGEFAGIYTIDDQEETLNPLDNQGVPLIPVGNGGKVQGLPLPLSLSGNSIADLESTVDQNIGSTGQSLQQFGIPLPINENVPVSSFSTSQVEAAVGLGAEVGVALPILNNGVSNSDTERNVLNVGLDGSQESVLDIMRREGLTSSIEILEATGLMEQLQDSGNRFS